MNLGQARTMFLGLLNRQDCTSDLADSFLSLAFQRAARDIKTPAMEKIVQFPALSTPTEQVPIPSDFVELIDLYVNPAQSTTDVYGALTMLPYRELIKLPTDAWVRSYGRLQTNFHFRGVVPAGGLIQMHYYGALADLTSDTATNEVLLSSPDLVIYAALSIAGDWFQSPKAADWEARYGVLRDQIIQQSAMVDWKGGSLAVSPAHPYGMHS